MLQLKDLRGRAVGEIVTERDERILEKLEGLRGGQAWSQARKESCQINEAIITYQYLMSSIIISDSFAWG